MTDDKKLIFYIDAYSPETIPMAKLAEYMADFAALLGKEYGVHFDHLESGSTIVSRVEYEDLPKVTTRLNDIRQGTAPKELAQIFEQIDIRLANDNAIGRVLEEGKDGATAELLAFPGRNRPKGQSYGPFTQEGHLDGVLISVGGKDETIRIRLQNGDTIYSKIETTRTIARELAKHLFEPVRIYGPGRWLREADGRWTLIGFRVHRFDVLQTGTLLDTVAALRAVPGSGWKDMDDPLAELAWQAYPIPPSIAPRSVSRPSRLAASWRLSRGFRGTVKTAAAVLAVGALVGIGYPVFLAPAPSVKSGALQELTAAAVPSLSAPPLNPRQTDEVIAALIDKAEAAIAQGSFGSGPDDDVGMLLDRIGTLAANASPVGRKLVMGIPERFSAKARVAASAGRIEDARRLEQFSHYFQVIAPPTAPAGFAGANSKGAPSQQVEAPLAQALLPSGSPPRAGQGDAADETGRPILFPKVAAPAAPDALPDLPVDATPQAQVAMVPHGAAPVAADLPALAPGQPGYDAGQSAYAAGRFIDALRIWRPLADRGDPRAAFGLGLLYDLGEGVGQFQLPPLPKGSNVFDEFGKPAPKLVQAEAGIACPPRDTFENAQAWVHERLKCERHPTPNDPWIQWAEYCPSGPLGYFVLKVKSGQQKVYLFENMPPAVWEGFKAAPSADKFYHSEIKGKHHWFRLGSELKPSAPELCHR